ncbi:hypothetical protein Tdes44962_MAKER01712 [Teratosphaeria destructans]|uniref:Uncharacterized protein n=1 Tax=Teratosphaeria destructans TaxID=418781 RepID=A0A9W7SY36_9PEZI|nr:hypothetical protein Tdes44962_MAKER01712 [Teratosphaeria destructans]
MARIALRRTIKKNFELLPGSCREVKEFLRAGKPAAALRCTLSALHELICGTVSSLVYILGVVVATVYVQCRKLHVGCDRR